jgi:lysophospholipase L1-like esterase
VAIAMSKEGGSRHGISRPGTHFHRRATDTRHGVKKSLVRDAHWLAAQIGTGLTAAWGLRSTRCRPGDPRRPRGVHPCRVGHPWKMTSSQADAPEVYVALGDSISIDAYAGGPGRGGASLLARNRDDDFPDWRGHDLATARPELGFWLLAMDGGTTSSLLDVQLPRLESAGAVPRVVTVTVGGNDVLGAYGDTLRALESVAVVRARVGRALNRLHALVPPGHPLIVGTVYDPSDGTGEAWRVGLPPWPDVVDVLAELNATLRAAAAEHGAVVADIHERFLGHGLQAGNPGQDDARPRNRALWYRQIIEPNAWGADAVRGAFWAAVQEHARAARDLTAAPAGGVAP